MPLKTIVADALGAFLSQIIMSRGLSSLSGIEEGRFPKWLTPIIVPKSPVGPGIEDRDFVFDSPLKLTTLGFGIGFAGFLWYAAREMDRAQLADLGAEQMEFDLGKEMSEFREPEQPELFTAKRTLTLEMEDIAKSDDPIFACMERRGYTHKQMDRLSDSISEKATVEMFDKEPEDLSSSELKFQDDIQGCIDTVTKVFGSMVAAGYEDCDCQLPTQDIR